MSRPLPSTRADYRAFLTLTTRWMDNDIYGHMNNVVHYSLFDSARERVADRGRRARHCQG